MTIIVDSESIEFLRKNGHFPEKYYIINQLPIPKHLTKTNEK